MKQVRRIFIEKKSGYDVSAQKALEDFKITLHKKSLQNVRLLVRYDIEGIDEQTFKKALRMVFFNPATDIIYFDNLVTKENDIVVLTELLPGQYDQRADNAAECIKLIEGNVTVKSADVYVLSGIGKSDARDIKNYIINPIDSREASDILPQTLNEGFPKPQPVPILHGFCSFDEKALCGLLKEYALAMSYEDIKFVQAYFRDDEKRDPTFAEIRVFDTYWSDHCRHTTFFTKLDIKFDETAGEAKKVYEEYLKARKEIGNKKDICLMDIATLYMKEAKHKGLMQDFDESNEINACSIKQRITVDGKPQDYLIMFKNETHNHPTEIEPFGGAATCLGGAIRDPLSGRSYVYGAMRITGSGDPREAVEDTMAGKLPQNKICRQAAAGYSSYGNQIGVAAGLVEEIYHEGYKAKRMELGAVVGAAPAQNVVRKKPVPGDLILLIGGETGRDGCGGATGSSKAHDTKSIDTCGAEVQKGNPIIERKIQRLFRNKDFARLVKRCNDFGAGGVSVAIGELADGVQVNLDLIRKKYEGLSGTELAISESQERMAIVIDKKDLETVINLARNENLHATHIANVTDRGRMELIWQGDTIVSIKRDFLNTNGVTAAAQALVANLNNYELFKEPFTGNLSERLCSILSDINICSKKGLVEMFDSTAGASTVHMPLGGKNQLTPVQAMAMKIAADGECSDASLFSYGFDPYMMEKNPFIGAVYSVVLSLAKIAASGGDISRAWLTLQEYFERLADEESWGKPAAALLGAWWAQRNFATPAIGGKDSMSGTFEDIHVPPTLVSFALCTKKAADIISPEFKKAENGIYRIRIEREQTGMPCFEGAKKMYAKLLAAIESKTVVSACAVERGGALAAIAKMALGNDIGADLNNCDIEEMSCKAYGDIIVEGNSLDFERIGTTGGQGITLNGETVSLEKLHRAYEKTLSCVYPAYKSADSAAPDKLYDAANIYVGSVKKAKPHVIIPVLPGTNCEYDSANAFLRSGAVVKTQVIKNLNARDYVSSIEEFIANIDNSQILFLPGGFSGIDEHIDSAIYLAAFMNISQIKHAVEKLLNRDGLILGISSGFQALVKLGLLPYGAFSNQCANSPTVALNCGAKHISKMVRTRISSNASPWLAMCNLGEIHSLAVSNRNGRFCSTLKTANELLDNGQIATQYVDENGAPTMGEGNPSGSMFAIEGILSADGRIFGKMANSERYSENTFKNVPGNKDQRIFESGVNYFL